MYEAKLLMSLQTTGDLSLGHLELEFTIIKIKVRWSISLYKDKEKQEWFFFYSKVKDQGNTNIKFIIIKIMV